MVSVFNRSHYEDVLVVRVHDLVPKEIWSKRYDFINDFEKLLRRESNTHVLKFFLHISKEEQLKRFLERLVDPARNWKISEDDYREREYWDDYMKAYEDVFAETSTRHAPWYVIPANQKWFRNLAVSQIIAATMEDIGMQMPKAQIDLEVIRRQYHLDANQEKSAVKKRKK
jgi:polyphosphate kinase 2 (PPK2 family)